MDATASSTFSKFTFYVVPRLPLLSNFQQNKIEFHLVQTILMSTKSYDENSTSIVAS